MSEEEIIPTPPCKDKLGQLLEVGDVIVYGHLMGRSAGLRIGRIENIRAYQPYYSNVGMKPRWGITVRGIDDSWTHRPVELNKRTGTLLYPDRIIRLPRAVVPLEYLKLLEVI